MHYPQQPAPMQLGKAACKDLEKLKNPKLLKRLTALMNRSHPNGSLLGKPLRSQRDRRLRSMRIGSYRAIIESLTGGDTIVAIETRSELYRRL